MALPGMSTIQDELNHSQAPQAVTSEPDQRGPAVAMIAHLYRPRRPRCRLLARFSRAQTGRYYRGHCCCTR
eukprot:scaffold1969_cov417-Prasinococcus_capsulatus_cf.AAC.5